MREKDFKHLSLLKFCLSQDKLELFFLDPLLVSCKAEDLELVKYFVREKYEITDKHFETIIKKDNLEIFESLKNLEKFY